MSCDLKALEQGLPRWREQWGVGRDELGKFKGQKGQEAAALDQSEKRGEWYGVSLGHGPVPVPVRARVS